MNEQTYFMLRTVPSNIQVFLRTYGYVKKTDISKNYWNLKCKLGVNTHFLEKFLEQSFQKAAKYLKMHGYPYSFFLDCNNPKMRRTYAQEQK